MEGLRVATINMSWEANNARPENMYIPAGVPASNKNQSFERSRDAWVGSAGVPHDKFGPAYELVVSDLKALQPPLDIILLQEFQLYALHNGRGSIDTLVDSAHLGDYTVVAVAPTKGPDPPAACVVLVRSAILSETEMPRDLSAQWKDFNDSLAAFPSGGRPVAIADVSLKLPGQGNAQYRIISSHSAHHKPWKTPKYVQAYLNRFAKTSKDKPLHLVWGGDFNSQLSAPDQRWLKRKVYKVPRARLPGDTTEFERKVDWILGTSVTNRNPTDVAITKTASDHRIVAQTLRAGFADLAVY